MNKCFISGRLTADPQSATTSNENRTSKFTVAVDRRRSQETDFFRVTAWNKLADICQQYLKKGREVTVIGSIGASAYQANSGDIRASLELMADDVVFHGNRTETQQAAPVSAPVQAETKDPGSEYVVVDDELPFE